jgi:hypothetical protein
MLDSERLLHLWTRFWLLIRLLDDRLLDLMYLIWLLFSCHLIVSHLASSRLLTELGLANSWLLVEYRLAASWLHVKSMLVYDWLLNEA